MLLLHDKPVFTIGTRKHQQERFNNMIFPSDPIWEGKNEPEFGLCSVLFVMSVSVLCFPASHPCSTSVLRLIVEGVRAMPCIQTGPAACFHGGQGDQSLLESHEGDLRGLGPGKPGQDRLGRAGQPGHVSEDVSHDISCLDQQQVLQRSHQVHPSPPLKRSKHSDMPQRFYESMGSNTGTPTRQGS